MTRRFVTSVALAWAAMGMLGAGGATAQQIVALSTRGPRFLQAPSRAAKPVEIDIRSSKLLTQLVSLNADRLTVGDVLAAIERQTGAKFIYSRNLVAVDRPARLRAERIAVAAALTAILIDAGIDVLLQGNHLALVERSPVDRQGEIVGRVTDAKTGLPIVGAEVYLEKTSWRTNADTGGRYRLVAVDTGHYTLATRRVAYGKRSVPVVVVTGKTDTVDLTLEPVAVSLDEVVSTVTGPRRRIELGNDITTLNADSIVRNEPITSVTDLLENRVPGLTVQRTSGAPGDPARIRIRGMGSPLLNNDPLIIIDGIRSYSQQSAGRSVNLAQIGSDGGVNDTAASSNRSNAFATPSPLDYIDPNSIEKIEVLKGPSAATLYGQDAANGVIVITTKRGKAGPTRWNASFDYGQDRVEGKFPEAVVRWGHPSTSSDPNGHCFLGNRGVFILIEGAPAVFETPCDADSVVRFQLLNDPALTVLDRAHRAGGTLSASGGSAALTYALSGSYREQQGLLRLPAYERDEYKARVGAAPPDWMVRPQQLKYWGVTGNLTARLGAAADLSFTSTISRTNQQRSSLEQRLGSLMTLYLDKASGVYYNATGDGALVRNGVTDTLLNNYYTRATDQATLLSNAMTFDWRARPWLRITATGGINVTNRADETYLPQGAAIGEDSVGRLGTGHGVTTESTMDLRASVPEVRLFGGARGAKFRFSTGIGYNGSTTRDQSFQTKTLPEGEETLGKNIVGQALNVSDVRSFRWFAEPGIGFRNFWVTSQLQLHQAGTTDGSLTRRFFDNLKQQLKFPPTFHTSYLLSEAPFFPFKDLFQAFRVRAAFGRTVRQPGLTQRLRVYTQNGVDWADGAYGNTEYVASLGNPELRPERSREFEGGVDADLLNYGLSLSITAYRKTTDDMIMSVTVPPSVNGGDVISTNIGNARNTGVELQATVNLLRNGPIGWSATVGLSKNRNVLVALAPGRESFYTTGNATFGGLRIAPGYPIGGRWRRPILAYADANDDGVLASDEVVYGDTAVYIGQTVPSTTANLQTTLSIWHALEVRAGFGYNGGVSQVNGVLPAYQMYSVGLNDPANATLHDQLAAVAPVYVATQTVSSYRLQDVAITYRVPPTLARRLGAQNLNVSLQGTNLGLWTNYSGLDPNVNAFSTGGNVVDVGTLPMPRTWSLRVNASY